MNSGAVYVSYLLTPASWFAEFGEVLAERLVEESQNKGMNRCIETIEQGKFVISRSLAWPRIPHQEHLHGSVSVLFSVVKFCSPLFRPTIFPPLSLFLPTRRFSKRGIDTGRMAVSLAETTIIRRLAKPVTIPAKLWLTFKFVRMVNLHGGEESARKGDNDTKASRKWMRSRENGKNAESLVATDEASRGGRRDGSPMGGGVRSRGWWKRSAGKRRAICPPGRSRGQGCFVPALTNHPPLSKPVRL